MFTLRQLCHSPHHNTYLDTNMFAGKSAAVSTSWLWLETNKLETPQATMIGLALAQLLPDAKKNISQSQYDQKRRQGSFHFTDTSHSDQVHYKVDYRFDQSQKLSFMSINAENGSPSQAVEIGESRSPTSSIASSRKSSPHRLQLQLLRSGSRSSSVLSTTSNANATSDLQERRTR